MILAIAIDTHGIVVGRVLDLIMMFHLVMVL
jgi:hypothetical protein